MLIDINRNPTPRQLRQFAASTVVMLPLITWLWTRQPSTAAFACVPASIMAVLGVARPKTLKPIFVGMSLITWPIGCVVSEIIIFLLFYGVFVPAGFVSQLFRRDPLGVSRKSNLDGAWKVRTESKDARRYYRMS